MRKKTWSLILFAAAMTICFGNAAFGQEITGSILGTVRDASGAVVPGATVQIIDSDKGNIVVRTVTSNASGEFSAPNLPVSTYSVSVEAANFKKTLQTGVKLDVGQRRSVEVALQPGEVAETVTVEADPITVDLYSATSGTLISGDQVRELPINNRNFVQLVTLAPGVSSNLSDQVYVGTTNPDGQANTVNISVNGARSSQNTFTVDGADVTDRGSNLTIQAYPSVDSIGEFRVLRSLFPAESGRSGGGQVNVVTRSGTDEFHGSFFEFVRNDAFNASSYFNNQTRPLGTEDGTPTGPARKAPFRYNNFGWTVGGPVWFLRLGEADPGDSVFAKIPRTFFFFSQEFRRDIRYPTLVSTVPDQNLRQGIFPVDICLQATGTVCNTILPAGTPLGSVATINPVSQQYLNYIYNKLPLPNNPSAGVYSLAFPSKGIAKFQQEIVKIDTSFNDRISMYYRYQRDKIPTTDVNALFSTGSSLPGVSVTETDSPGRTHTAQMTFVIDPKVILEARYNFGYGAILSHSTGLNALANSPITPPLPYPVTRDRVPSITGLGFNGVTGFGPYDNFSWKQNGSLSLSWITGSHSFKFGAIYSKYRKNENALAGNNEGNYSGFLTPGGTANVLAPGVTGTLNQNRQLWANFLLGTNASFSQASFDYTADLRQMTFEGFAQDEWRLSDRLTAYIGVRYSFFGSPWDKNGRLTNFVPELFNPAAAPLVTGAGNRVAGAGKNFCNGLIANTNNYQTGPAAFNCTPTPSPWGKFVVDAPKTDFAPRVGLAWDPFGKGTTSIRTGYGIYHDQVLNGTLLQQIGLNPPYQQTCTVTGINIANPVPGGNCTVASSTLAPNIRGLQSDWKTPYVQHWSLDLQHQVWKNAKMTIGYYGSKGVNLIGSTEINELPAGYAISRGPTGCAVGSSTTPTAPCQVAGTAFFSSAATRILDQLRPYRGYQSINLIETRYNSTYHSLQVAGEQRFARGSTLNIAYTWSKNLTDNQSDRSHAPQNTYNLRDEWGRAAFDRRHILTASYDYEIPFFNDYKGVAGLVLGGWRLQGLATVQTGLPLTAVTSAFDPAGFGFIPALVAGGRPMQTCDPNDGAANTQQQWFNTACFTPNPASSATNIANVPGSAGRGTIFGPGTKRVDLTLAKNFNFTESMRLQLRAESYNLFNWTNFTTIVTNVTASNFGRATGTRDPRTFAFGAKFYW